MRNRHYTATARIHEDTTLEHAHRQHLVQFEYTSAHRNGSRENKNDCRQQALKTYGALAIPCDIIFTHIIHK